MKHGIVHHEGMRTGRHKLMKRIVHVFLTYLCKHAGLGESVEGSGGGRPL